MKAIGGILIFITGAGLGACGGFLAARKVLGDRCESDIEEVRTYYTEELKMLKAENAHLQEVMDSAAKVAAVALKEESEKEEKKKKKANDEEQAEEIIEKMDYASVSKKKPVTKKAELKPDLDIFVITAKDFQELNGYEKVTLTYFPDEDRFLDDANSDYDTGFEEVGGTANLEMFEDGYLYVRNRFTETDYEVIRELRSFKRYMYEEMGE